MRYIIIHEATKATAKKHIYMRGNKNAPEISSIYRWMVGLFVHIVKVLK